MVDMDEGELKSLIKLGRKYKWCDADTRAYLEEHGIILGVNGFYGETPTIEDINKSFEYADSIDVNDAPAIFDDQGIFNLEKMSKFIDKISVYSSELNAPIDGVNGSNYYWNNGQFSASDAFAYHSVIRHIKPKRIVEIGSGYSTYIANDAVTKNGSGEIICIDPEPRASIEGLSNVEFRACEVQSIDVRWFNEKLESGDIVFYDGSHSLKTGSDTVYFYLKVLPYLKSGVIVHSHDTRLPYPRNRKALIDARLYWGEPYLLMAHLHNARRYEVLFACEFLRRRSPGKLKELRSEYNGIGGTSIWYQIL